MKVISSEGGPFIELFYDKILQWSSVAGKQFVGENADSFSDYDALCETLDRVCSLARCLTKIEGASNEALLMMMPLETAVIESNGMLSHIAQVHYVDVDRTFSRLSKRDFKIANSHGRVAFVCKGGIFVFLIQRAREQIYKISLSV